MNDTSQHSLARFAPTKDGTHLLHVVDGDLNILVEIGADGIAVVLRHNGRESLMDFEWPIGGKFTQP